MNRAARARDGTCQLDVRPTKTRGTGSGNDLDRVDGFSVLAVIISYLSRATKKGVWGPLGKVKRIASSVTDLGRRHRGSVRSWGEQGEEQPRSAGQVSGRQAGAEALDDRTYRGVQNSTHVPR